VVARINPLQLPPGFSASMSVGPSQFGIDEEEMEAVLPAIAALPGVELLGFHVYSGTNSLDAEAVAQNFAIFTDIFRRAQAMTGIRPRVLIFGAGFGVPYLPTDAPLDHEALPALVNPMLDALRAEPAFAEAALTLELGRWLVGPAGWLMTGVVAAKRSRGVEIRACDAGFNNHLAACGMMGSVIRRNWRFANLSNPHGAHARYMLVGPLCTTIDRLAANLELPEVRVGDVLAIEQSGAYGLTASPVKFISHPEPREVVWADGAWRDASETRLNHWPADESGAGDATPRA
jgi:diaminopimelate decarboxylase